MSEWAVELRPTDLDRMVGQEANREIVRKWIETDTLPNALIFYGRSGSGKALPNYQKVLTTEGYIPIRDIKIGDMVASNDGHYYPVTGVFPQGIKPVYDITFCGGISVRASDEHIWTISRDYGKTYHNETTKQILDKGYSSVEKKTGWTHHTVELPDVKPLERSDSDLPVDPYLLGVLLGDGSIAQGNFSISSPDRQILDKVSHILDRDWGMELHYKNHLFDYQVVSKEGTLKRPVPNNLRRTLQQLGLLVKSTEKFIPKEYFVASVSQRKELIAGLMDTDGYIDKTGGKTFNTSSQRLAQDIKFILETLGYRIKMRTFIPDYTYNGERRKGKQHYQLDIFGTGNLCTLESKLLREQKRKTRSRLRVESIKYYKDEECTCISIAAPNHIFLTENGVPTHNTTMSRMIPKIMDAELIELDAASHNSVDDARQINEQALRMSLTGRHKIFLVDEAHMLSTAAWNALLKTIEEPNPKCHFIFATTEYTKLPMTIRGRSRMLKFYSLPKEQLKEYAQAVLDYKGYTLPDEVLDLVVDQANGQVRDLLKVLQTAAEGQFTVDKFKKFFAIPDNAGMNNYINGVLTNNKKNALKVLNSIDTDLIEWITGLKKRIYQLLEHKYGVTPINFGNNITLETKTNELVNKFSDMQWGSLLSELNKIDNAQTAYAQLYALLFRGIGY